MSDSLTEKNKAEMDSMETEDDGRPHTDRQRTEKPITEAPLIAGTDGPSVGAGQFQDILRFLV